ncbi:hypothetical protein COH38_02660 [Neisseria meningitidis]|nr:hypothetical protein COH38_02660 [Neisseria meningitidis]
MLPVPSEGGSGFLRGHSRLSLFPPLSVIPAQAGIQSVRFQPFPIDSCRVWGLDSRLRGNDGGGGFCFFR